jgi:DNA-binding response OmpR family regulator
VAVSNTDSSEELREVVARLGYLSKPIDIDELLAAVRLHHPGITTAPGSNS